jgi:hypothetical protein
VCHTPPPSKEPRGHDTLCCPVPGLALMVQSVSSAVLCHVGNVLERPTQLTTVTHTAPQLRADTSTSRWNRNIYKQKKPEKTRKNSKKNSRKKAWAERWTRVTGAHDGGGHVRCARSGCEKKGSKRCGGCKQVCVSHQVNAFCIQIARCPPAALLRPRTRSVIPALVLSV